MAPIIGYPTDCIPGESYCDTGANNYYICGPDGQYEYQGPCPVTSISTSLQEFTVVPTEVILGTSVTVTGYLRNALTGAGLSGRTIVVVWSPPAYENYVLYKNVVTDSTGKFTCVIAGADMPEPGSYAVEAYFNHITVNGVTYGDSNRAHVNYSVIVSCPGGVEVSSCLGACTDPAIAGFAYYCEPGTGHKYLCTQNKQCNWCYVPAGECGAPCTPNAYLDPITCQDGSVIYASQCNANGFGTHQTMQTCPENYYVDTSISLAVSNSILNTGETQTISGKLSTSLGAGLGGASLGVYTKAPGASTFTKLATVVTDANGNYTHSFVVNVVGTYYVYVGYAGTAPTGKMAIGASENVVAAYAGEW